jgi:hypothetical protein
MQQKGLSSMHRALLLILVALLIPGCASLQPIDRERLNAMERIGVISLLGDEMQIKKVGTTVFNNVEKYEQVGDWKIDEFVKGVVRDEIITNGRLTYVELAGDQQELRQKYFERERADKIANPDSVKNELKQIADAASVDTLVLVVRMATGDPFSDTNQYVYGYGLYHRSFFMYDQTGVFGRALIVVKDAKTMEELRKRGVPSKRVVDDSYWTLEFAQLPLEKRQYIENTIKDEMKASLKIQLNRLGLTN